MQRYTIYNLFTILSYFVPLLDIDECALGIHECYPHEKCINLIGDYECEDPNYSEEIKACPEGFTFDAENHVCNGELRYSTIYLQKINKIILIQI